VSVDELPRRSLKDVVVTPDFRLSQAVGGTFDGHSATATKDPAYIANVLRRGYPPGRARLLRGLTRRSDREWIARFFRVKLDSPYLFARPTTRPARFGGVGSCFGIASTLAIGFVVCRKVSGHRYGRRPPCMKTPAAAVGIGEASVAVLPFVDMSDKKDQEYFRRRPVRGAH